MTLDRAWAASFAADWIEAWNSRDIDRIVAHYTEDAVFISPVAESRVGRPRVTGHDALRTYWSGAHRYTQFVFELERITWDEPNRELVITYRRTVDGARSRACEFFRFTPEGLVSHGEAMYGASGDS